MPKTIHTELDDVDGQPIKVSAVVCTGCVRVEVMNTSQPSQPFYNPLCIYGETALHVMMELEASETARNLPKPIHAMVRRACTRLHIEHIRQMFGEA